MTEIPFKTTPEQAKNIASYAEEMEKSGVDIELISRASELAKTDQGMYELMELFVFFKDMNGCKVDHSCDMAETIVEIQKSIADYDKLV